MSDNRKFRLTTFSIVVVASHHNPMLLNPDFLKIQKIIPEDLQVENTLTTLPLSFVKFKNGLSITVEPDKLQVVQTIEREMFEDSTVPEVTSQYVKTLPHVKYTAAGINWIGYAKMDKPADWIRNRFLADGNWNQKPYDVTAMGLRLTYDVDETKCNLAVSDSEVKKNEEAPFPAVTINVNYHCHVTEKEPSCNDIAKVILKWKYYEQHFKKILADVLNMEA